MALPDLQVEGSGKLRCLLSKNQFIIGSKVYTSATDYLQGNSFTSALYRINPDIFYF
jgi:hypothetical protein